MIPSGLAESGRLMPTTSPKTADGPGSIPKQHLTPALELKIVRDHDVAANFFDSNSLIFRNLSADRPSPIGRRRRSLLGQWAEGSGLSLGSGPGCGRWGLDQEGR